MIIEENESLKNLNTFGIDVSSKYFAEISSVNDLLQLLSEEKYKSEQKLILGGGSNILFTKNYNGLIIANNIKGITVEDVNENEVIISASGGEVWDDLVDFAVNNNYGGIENLKLIPGKVGASPIQNIGAYGVELKDTFLELTAINIHTLEEVRFKNQECRFNYRYSIFKDEYKDQFIITDVKFKLSKNPKINIEYDSLKKEIEIINPSELTIKVVSEAVKRVRESKLPDPLKIGNAGSFFKNPTIDKSKLLFLQKGYEQIPNYIINENEFKIPAGWLIEKSGLKGIQMGNAGTYKNQALVLINNGNASGKEILDLALYIQNEVKKNFGIELIPEVNII
ncbi:MAG: UDP-N-acetylenolpyruvoylglucosamine reductase [Ignavibacteriae bacterium]|nr:UDP-N-acetylenolpyruvoylglucosamine reductase [Ignavibacteriota bacterium]